MGWIKINRKLLNSEAWCAEPFTRGQAWVDLIGLAAFRDGYIRVRGVRINITRGQCAHSQETLAERWQWSRGKIKRFLNELENDQKIIQQTVQQTNIRKSLITICNYNKYQAEENVNDTTDDTIDDTKDGRKTVERQYSIKECKRMNKEGRKEGEDYFFLGKNFNLKKSDYEKWRATYHAIPDFETQVRTILQAYDAEGKDRWFFAASQLLNNKHQEFLQRQARYGGSESKRNENRRVV